MVVVVVPMGGAFFRLLRQFANIQQDLKRLESVSRSPIFSSLSETLVGLETIRAYGASERFLNTHRARMDVNHKFFWTFWMCTSWVTARLEMATAVILLAVAILAVCLGHTVSPVTLGLALSYSLMLTALFQRVVQVSIDMAVYMTSCERVQEYLDIEPEPNVVVVVGTTLTPAPAAAAGVGVGVGAPPAEWPAQGVVEFRDVHMQYRDNPPVLRGVSFRSRAGERIGICGRTGAGKSSLMTALFRVAPLMRGQIWLDGVDIQTVPLQRLRSALAIIPQDPVLFTGTVRFQLDPFAQYSDAAVWAALEQVNMATFVRASPGKLDEVVLEGGENLSQGQRQLLCIARALLRRARVLVMDEGTSAVDPHTDALIQTVLRESAVREGTLWLPPYKRVSSPRPCPGSAFAPCFLTRTHHPQRLLQAPRC
jgi:ABC-type multidrug transport system fused ATPase/permease subunit